MGFGKDGKGVILRERNNESLAALASGSGEIFTSKYALVEDFRMISTEINVTVELVSDAGIHGTVFGIANGNLTIAEIEQVLDGALGPFGPSDRIGEEVAERFVKILGVFENPSGGLEANLHGKHGEPLIRETIRWTFTNTDSWVWFVYNNTGVTMGTGNGVQIMATHYGVWLV